MFNVVQIHIFKERLGDKIRNWELHSLENSYRKVLRKAIKNKILTVEGGQVYVSGVYIGNLLTWENDIHFNGTVTSYDLSHVADKDIIDELLRLENGK